MQWMMSGDTIHFLLVILLRDEIVRRGWCMFRSVFPRPRNEKEKVPLSLLAFFDWKEDTVTVSCFVGLEQSPFRRSDKFQSIESGRNFTS